MTYTTKSLIECERNVTKRKTGNGSDSESFRVNKVYQHMLDYNYRISVPDMPFGACCIYGDDTHSGRMSAYLQ